MGRSVRGETARVSKRQATLRSYAKVTKVTTPHPDVKIKLEEAVQSPAIKPEETVKPVNKRKRSEVEDDSETEPQSANVAAAESKKPRLQLPTPPRQRRAEEEDSIDIEFSPPIQHRSLSPEVKSEEALTEPLFEGRHPILQDFAALHSAFLRAFSVHMVHNGESAPADLDTLMISITGLWKRHTITKEDIQRVLAIYEVELSEKTTSGRVYKHDRSPFKLTKIGGCQSRYHVEFVGEWGYDELEQQTLYESGIDAICVSQRYEPEGWLHGDMGKFPRLAFTVGFQTQVRTGKAAAALREIMGLASQAQPREIYNYPDAERMHTPRIVKDRTLSLIDRVRAKAMANSAAIQQKPELILRRYAIGRIQEVTEIIRMSQQRKLSASFMSSIHSSPGQVRGKVTFSMTQLIKVVKESLVVPIGTAEIRLCIDILANDIPEMWMSVYEVGNVQCVTLEGTGPSGLEVREHLEHVESLRDGSERK